MKSIHLFLAIFLIIPVINGCKKESVHRSTTTAEVLLNNCNQKETGESQPFQVCFTKMITESRCPNGAVCVWAGYAQAQFSLIRNNDTTLFELATPSVLSLANDTVINGVKVTLENILPYPDLINPSTEPTKAILKVEEQ